MNLKRIWIVLLTMVLFFTAIVPVSANRGEMPVARDKGSTSKASLEVERRSYGNKVKNLQSQYSYLGNYVATAYAPSAGGINGSGDYTTTATGTKVTEGRTVAVDHLTIPYGSVMSIKVNGNSKYDGLYLAEDTGGAIVFNRIDILIEPYGEAIDFGRKNVDIQILEYGTGAEDARNKASNWEDYLGKYSNEAGPGYKYDGVISDGVVESDVETDEGSGKYTPNDYFIYRSKVAGENTGVQDEEMTIGQEISNWFYVFSEGTMKWLLRIGWIMASALIGYVTLYVIAFLAVRKGFRVKWLVTDKMMEEAEQAAAYGVKGSFGVLKRAAIALALMFLFGTGMYIPLMAFVYNILVFWIQ